MLFRDEIVTGWSVVAIVITAFILLTIVLMFIVIIVFVIVIRRRHRLTRGQSTRRDHRRRRRDGSIPSIPDYDAPYIIYGPPGPNSERQLRMVGVDGEARPVDGASLLPAFKGMLVQPPPYPEDPPPAFPEELTSTDGARSSAENHGFEAENTASTSPENV